MQLEGERSNYTLNALVRSNGPRINSPEKLTGSQITEIRRWREREEELSPRIARSEAVRLAKQILDVDRQLVANERHLDELAGASEATPLLDEPGFIAIMVAKCLVA